MFKINNLTVNSIGPFGHESQTIIAGSATYTVIDELISDFTNDQNLIVAVQSKIVSLTVGSTVYQGSLAEGVLGTLKPQNVQLMTQTPDKRSIIAVNRIPAGFTVYPTGAGDDIANKVYGAGDKIVLENGSLTKEFQLLNHFYVFGGRIIWESATLDDSLDAWLLAPPSQGWVQQAGDFNLVSGVMLVPAAPGQGSYNVDLAAKIGTTQILKSTPVPASGNNGFFDYNSDTNVLSVNSQQKGNVNLYNIEIKLFKFGNKILGRKQDGAESVFESSDVVGKLLYNTWKLRFTLNQSITQISRAGVIITAGAKANQ